MEWIIDSETAFDEWSKLTDPIEDSELRLAVGEAMIGWREVGPPPDALYDDVIQAWVCDMPGTPVVAEFVKATFRRPPVAIVVRFRWVPPLN